jgi:hypothetical protein
MVDMIPVGVEGMVGKGMRPERHPEDTQDIAAERKEVDRQQACWLPQYCTQSP